MGEEANLPVAERPPAFTHEALKANLHTGPAGCGSEARFRSESANERGQDAPPRCGAHDSARALTTASARRGRNARWARFSRVGCTRFESRMTNSSRSGSIHIDVPV